MLMSIFLQAQNLNHTIVFLDHHSFPPEVNHKMFVNFKKETDALGWPLMAEPRVR